MSLEEDEDVIDVKGLAAQVVITCGVCRALVIGRTPRALLRALWLSGFDAEGYDSEIILAKGGFHLPFPDESFDVVVYFGGLECVDGESVSAVLEETRRITRRSLILHIDTTRVANAALDNRRAWEVYGFDTGFRKHPLYYRTNDYASLEHESDCLFIPLEKVPAEAWVRYPMAVLREERDLHMDMLRESGSRSDAHVGRYHFAARFIRPGDAVLDAACGLGYGTYVVRSETRARSFIGIDASEYGVDYAQLSFGGDSTSFRHGMLPDCLESIPDNSIDHILCFETLEHVEDPIRLLAEFQRVLSPGGRLTCSVPHDWSDETGEDPNPFHFHVYDKARFVAELSRYFDLESLFTQTADRVKQPGGACVWLKRPRALAEISVDQDEIEAEWLLAVVAKSPLEGRHVPYDEHVFSPEELSEAGDALAFERDYDNPWLIRALVSIGLRTENAALRGRWAEAVWRDAAAGEADRGAALCVLAYSALAGGNEVSRFGTLECIDRYLTEVAESQNLTVLRWRVSLMYVGGLLALSSGLKGDAHRLFAGVVAAPVAQYSPTLLTKPAEAAYLQGLLLVGEGRGADAREVWWRALKRISIDLGDRLVRGYATTPPVFEIRELAAALALCGRLVAAMASVGEQTRRPGIFYDECHADSVFQVQSIAALEQMHTDLRRDFLNHQLGLRELEEGKTWLERQWGSLQEEVRSRDEELVRLSGAKDWLESQTESLQAELTRRDAAITALSDAKAWLEAQWRVARTECAGLQDAISALAASKNWLEAQWRAGQAQLQDKNAELDRLVEGKAWLERQWQAAQAELHEKNAELERLVEGKAWLEQQWRAGQAQVWARDDELKVVTEGKNWLESQWNAQAVELDGRLQCIEVLQSRIGGLEDQLASAVSRENELNATNAHISAHFVIAGEKAARLKKSLFFRVARRLGFFAYF